MKTLAALALMLLLAGCAGHQLAECKGPLFPLNQGQWQPTAADLTVQAAR